MTQAMRGRQGENMLGTSILHHSMEGTSSNGISNSTHSRGSQRTCAHTETSMAEQYEYIFDSLLMANNLWLKWPVAMN